MKQPTVILLVVALIAVLLCTVNAQQDEPVINPSTYSYQCRVNATTAEGPITTTFVDCSTLFTTCPEPVTPEGTTIEVLCVDTSNDFDVSEDAATDCINMVEPTQDCTYEYLCAPQQSNNVTTYTTCTDDVTSFISKLVVEEREIVNPEDPTANTTQNVTTIQLTRSVVCVSKGMYTTPEFSEDVNCVNEQPDIIKPVEQLTADVIEQEPAFVRQCQLFDQTGVEACPTSFTAVADQLKFCSGLKNEVFTEQSCTQKFEATFFTDKIVEITQACPINTELICHKYAMSCSNKFKGNETSSSDDDEKEPKEDEEQEELTQGDDEKQPAPVVEFRVTNTTETESGEEQPSQDGEEEPSQGGEEEPTQDDEKEDEKDKEDEEEEPSFPSGEIPAQQCVLQLPICPSCNANDIPFITNFTSTTVQYDTINCYRYNATGNMELIAEPTADEYALCMRASNITIDPKTIINDQCDVLDTCSYYQCSITQPTPVPTPVEPEQPVILSNNNNEDIYDIAQCNVPAEDLTCEIVTYFPTCNGTITNRKVKCYVAGVEQEDVTLCQDLPEQPQTTCEPQSCPVFSWTTDEIILAEDDSSFGDEKTDDNFFITSTGTTITANWTNAPFNESLTWDLVVCAVDITQETQKTENGTDIIVNIETCTPIDIYNQTNLTTDITTFVVNFDSLPIGTEFAVRAIVDGNVIVYKTDLEPKRSSDDEEDSSSSDDEEEEKKDDEEEKSGEEKEDEEEKSGEEKEDEEEKSGEEKEDEEEKSGENQDSAFKLQQIKKLQQDSEQKEEEEEEEEEKSGPEEEESQLFEKRAIVVDRCTANDQKCKYGQCVLNTTSSEYQCQCNTAWGGQTCESCVDNIIANVSTICHNGGFINTEDRTGGKYKDGVCSCTCPRGFSGAFCGCKGLYTQMKFTKQLTLPQNMTQAQWLQQFITELAVDSQIAQSVFTVQEYKLNVTNAAMNKTNYNYIVFGLEACKQQKKQQLPQITPLSTFHGVLQQMAEQEYTVDELNTAWKSYAAKPNKNIPSAANVGSIDVVSANTFDPTCVGTQCTPSPFPADQSNEDVKPKDDSDGSTALIVVLVIIAILLAIALVVVICCFCMGKKNKSKAFGGGQDSDTEMLDLV